MTKVFLALLVGVSVCLADDNDDQINVTLTELLAKPAQYLNKAICVEGSVAPGTPLCTKMACTAETPCCNTCSSQPYLKDGNQQILMTTGNQNLAEMLRCTWKDCSTSICQKFEAGARYQVQGIFSRAQAYYLEFTGAAVAPVTLARTPRSTRIASGLAQKSVVYDVRGRRILSGKSVRGVFLSGNGVRNYLEPRHRAVKH